ncbi:MAG TPA: DUF2917 domain-containing protein, partial [Burkholderiaceae bacterium]
MIELQGPLPQRFHDQDASMGDEHVIGLYPRSASLSPASNRETGFPGCDGCKERFMMILQRNATMSWLVDGPLSTGAAKLLRARQAGRLTVSAGQIWLTRSGDLDDHVLAAGQALAIRAHEQVVVEPWLNGVPARLAWRSDQRRALAARAVDALVAGAR